MENKTFAQKVREKYGDTVEEFALRMRATPETVKVWERGGEPQNQAMALLLYANVYNLSQKTNVDNRFYAMSPCQLIQYLMDYFDDSFQGLALRLNLPVNAIKRLIYEQRVSEITKRLFLEAIEHPENFMKYPKSFSK